MGRAPHHEPLDTETAFYPPPASRGHASARGIHRAELAGRHGTR